MWHIHVAYHITLQFTDSEDLCFIVSLDGLRPLYMIKSDTMHKSFGKDPGVSVLRRCIPDQDGWVIQQGVIFHLMDS